MDVLALRLLPIPLIGKPLCRGEKNDCLDTPPLSIIMVMICLEVNGPIFGMSV